MSKLRKSLNLFVLVALVLLLVVFVKYATSGLARKHLRTNQNHTDRVSVHLFQETTHLNQPLNRVKNPKPLHKLMARTRIAHLPNLTFESATYLLINRLHHN